jgi:hypothetical protein
VEAQKKDKAKSGSVLTNNLARSCLNSPELVFRAQEGEFSGCQTSP